MRYLQRAASTPATRLEVVALQERLDAALQERQVPRPPRQGWGLTGCFKAMCRSWAQCHASRSVKGLSFTRPVGKPGRNWPAGTTRMLHVRLRQTGSNMGDA